MTKFLTVHVCIKLSKFHKILTHCWHPYSLADLEDADPAELEPDPLDTTGPLPDPLGPGAGYPCGLMSAPDLSMIVEKSFLTDIAFTDEPVLAAMEEIPGGWTASDKP